MVAYIETNLLRDAVNKILSVIDKRNTRPILTYTLFEIKDNYITLKATDLEVSALVKVDANVENNFKFCVNAKNLFDILRELPEATLKLELEEGTNTLKLTCNDIFYNLLTCETEDFPHLVFENTENTFELTSEQILEIINTTSYAISNDDTRLFLNGIFLQEINSKLRAVATDGHRLSLLETDLKNSEIDTLINGIIIPRKGVFELKKIADSYPNTIIKISVDESFMYLNAEDNYLLSIRLIAREYPKYQTVIPNKTTYKINTDKESVMNAVKRIKIMANEKSNNIKFFLKDNEMTIMANHPSLGNAREKVNIQYTGKEMEIGFNAKYLLDTFTTLSDGDITVELNNELSPVLVKSSNQPNYLGVIMPLKL